MRILLLTGLALLAAAVAVAPAGLLQTVYVAIYYVALAMLCQTRPARAVVPRRRTD